MKTWLVSQRITQTIVYRVEAETAVEALRRVNAGEVPDDHEIDGDLVNQSVEEAG